MRRQRKNRCAECGEIVKRGLSAYRVTLGLGSEVLLGTIKSYLLHEWCLDPIYLIETTLDGWALYIEKDTNFGS